MTPKDNSGNAGRPLAAEVAIIGAGPVGLMTANLLGLAGICVLVLERNAGLLGLPRAIAYDAETLRLFSQVGLFHEIAPGLIQDPHVRHVNARNVTLMAADFSRGLYGHSALGTFFQPDFERVLLEGLARSHRSGWPSAMRRPISPRTRRASRSGSERHRARPRSKRVMSWPATAARIPCGSASASGSSARPDPERWRTPCSCGCEASSADRRNLSAHGRPRRATRRAVTSGCLGRSTTSCIGTLYVFTSVVEIRSPTSYDPGLGDRLGRCCDHGNPFQPGR